MKISVEQHDGISLGLRESWRDGRLVSEVPRQLQDVETMVAAAALLEGCDGAVHAAIVDECHPPGGGEAGALCKQPPL